MYWISTIRFRCFSGHIYVTCYFSKHQTIFMLFFSREYYLKIYTPSFDISFDMSLILILILHWSTGSIVPPSQCFFWEEELIEHKLLIRILLKKLFIGQTRQFQWSDGDHSVPFTSNFLKISNRHPRLVFWLILKHLKRRMNSNMEALFSLLLMSGMLMTLCSSGRLDNSNNRCQDVKSYILRETLCLHPDVLVLQQLSVNHPSVCRGGV